MSQEPKYTERESHKRFAVGLNNLVWQLLQKPDRTPDDDNKMVDAAHASAFHWRDVGSEINQVRGHWLISRVYSVLAKPHPAIEHATRCRDMCEMHGFMDFDIAYAYEAMARAHAAAGNLGEGVIYHRKAIEAGEMIAGDEDRELFVSDLESGPWNGLK